MRERYQLAVFFIWAVNFTSKIYWRSCSFFNTWFLLLALVLAFISGVFTCFSGLCHFHCSCKLLQLLRPCSVSESQTQCASSCVLLSQDCCGCSQLSVLLRTFLHHCFHVEDEHHWFHGGHRLEFVDQTAQYEHFNNINSSRQHGKCVCASVFNFNIFH